MKEIELSFKIRTSLKRTDVHWVEGELLRLREKVFVEVFRRVMQERETVVEALKGLALQCKGEDILQRVIVEASSSQDDEEREKTVEVMRHVRNNLDWIATIPKVEGYGSGPVEKTVDITATRRFKKREMSWYRGGPHAQTEALETQ